MSLTLEIWKTGEGGWTDYSAWLWSQDASAPLVSKTHQVSAPQQLAFALTNGVAGLVVPDAGNRIRVTTTSYGQWFTGYITKIPELQLLGSNASGNPVYGYKLTAVSEELRLEWQTSAAFPTLAPFSNMTQGAIIKSLIAVLGGGFDVANVQDGITIPFFRVKPDESFADAVRRLSDKTNMSFFTDAGYAYYSSYGTALGYSPSESDTALDPYALSINPVQNPVFNDVLGSGQVEPQAYVRELFVSDGLTGAYPLKFPMYGAASQKLLEDPFTAAAIDTSRWSAHDTNGLFSAYQGSLKMYAASSNTPSWLASAKGIDVSGNLELRAGRINFQTPSNVLVGGIYSADTGLLADMLAGFQCLPSGGQTIIRPVISGAPRSASYTTVAGKSYQFQLTVDVSQQQRVRRPFFSLYNSYGGETLAADATVSFSVIELDDNNPDAAAVEVFTDSAVIANIPAYLYYAALAGPQNGTDPVNLLLNFCSLYRPVQAELWHQAFGSSAWQRMRIGEDGADPLVSAAITIGSDQNPQLEYIGLKQPDPQTLIKIIYRSAGIARGRVQKASSITAEAAKAGDSGRRTGTLPAQNPAPRNAAEIERACQAYIDDRTNPLYSGEWSFNSKAYPPGSQLFPGRLITVNAPSRYAQFTALVTEVDTNFMVQASDDTEYFEHAVKFGPLYRFDDVSLESQPADEALAGALDTLQGQDPVEFASVGASHSADVVELELTAKTNSAVQLNAGMSPEAAFEVRKTDAAWGTASALNKALSPDPSTESFWIARAGNDIVALVKNRNSGGLVSRYPAAIRLRLPFIPMMPVLADVNLTDTQNPVFTFAMNAAEDPFNVYGIEIRASNNSTVLLSRQLVSESDFVFTADNAQRALSLTFYVYFTNLLGEYSSALVETASMIIPSAPTDLALTSGVSTALVRSDGTKISRVHVAWTASNSNFDGLNGFVDVEYKRTADLTWIHADTVTGDKTETYVTGVNDSVAYDVRVRSRNANGNVSAWTTATNHVVGAAPGSAGILLHIPLTNPLHGTDAGSSATISFDAWTMRVAGVGDTNYTATGPITGLDYDTLYYLYYDDPGLAGGAVTVYATTVKQDSISTSPGRFTLGAIFTPAQGGAATIGLSTAAPSSPTALALTADASTSLTRADGIRISRLLATWTAPSSNFDGAHGYVDVEYKKHSDSAWLHATTVMGDVTSAYISGVNDGMYYDVRVRARNVNGATSTWASSLNFPISTIIHGSLTYRPTTNPLHATDAGATATITVDPWTTRVVGVGDKSYTASSSITALSYKTMYYLYYDDSALAGGAVAVQATTDKNAALGSGTAVRFFLGSITTPAQAGADTIGNDDGGVGAQTGTIDVYYFSRLGYGYSTSPPIVVSDSSQPAALDADLSTSVQLVAFSAFGSALMLFAPPAVGVRYKKLTLKIRWGLSQNDLNLYTSSRNYFKISYGTRGVLTSWHNGQFAPPMYTLIAPVTNAVTVLAAGVIPVGITEIDIPIDSNLSQLAFLIETATYDATSGAIHADIYGAWIEAQY